MYLNVLYFMMGNLRNLNVDHICMYVDQMYIIVYWLPIIINLINHCFIVI